MAITYTTEFDVNLVLYKDFGQSLFFIILDIAIISYNFVVPDNYYYG